MTLSAVGRTAASIVAIVVMVAVFGALGSWDGLVWRGVPIFALLVTLALLVQWVAFVPAYLAQSEHYYDLVGASSYVVIALLGALAKSDPRSVLLALLIIVWAARLGSFLFSRIRLAGADRRFEGIRNSASRFLLAWTLQGLWIVLTTGAGLAAMTSSKVMPLGLWAWLGLALWLAGFLIEVVADRQKRQFRLQADNRDRFITSGLWAWSRHPNYFGEILLWVGIAMIAWPALVGWQHVTLISPLFVYLL
ncbi:MAG: DUF1295 domain-containing protein, partial [Halieaceae bacterium]|nr:DUF1295 domain-containing protein [Halieaceae bacterium]